MVLAEHVSIIGMNCRSRMGTKRIYILDNRYISTIQRTPIISTTWGCEARTMALL